MSEYVVAVFSHHTGTLEQDKVVADGEYDALLKSFDGDFSWVGDTGLSYEDALDAIFNSDQVVNIYKL